MPDEKERAERDLALGTIELHSVAVEEPYMRDLVERLAQKAEDAVAFEMAVINSERPGTQNIYTVVEVVNHHEA